MDGTTARHPRALYFLFLTEMWERFGFYTVQGLLVLYMTEYFSLSDNISYSILGTFTALVYIAPLAGGYLASNYLSFKTSILFGGITLIFGYALLAFSSTLELMYPALAIIIIGNGFLKPNISSLLGSQYQEKDPRREAGFTIFYVGINTGALLAGLSSGYIKQYFGWHISFLCASIGLVIGVIFFIIGHKTIRDVRLAKLSQRFKILFACSCLLAIALLSFLLQMNQLSDWLLPSAGVFLLMYLIYITWQQNALYRKRMIILNLLIISSIAYWTLLFQLFASGNLFVERMVDQRVFGIPLSPSIFWGSESVFIILLGPLFAWCWQRLANSVYNPSTITKFVLAILFAGACFLVLGISTSFVAEDGLINPFWVFLAYLLLTMGELLLSPIGLSAVTTLAPPRLIGLMMGVWFVATGFGGIFSGMIAKIASVPDTAVTVGEKLAIYQNAFFDYAYLAFIVATLLFFINLILKRWLRQN